MDMFTVAATYCDTCALLLRNRRAGLPLMMKNDELASLGIQAFQNGEYAQAVEFLSELITRQPALWTCRLYLAMALQCDGNETKAKEELSTISQWATDQTVKKKAVEALRAINTKSVPRKAVSGGSSVNATP